MLNDQNYKTELKGYCLVEVSGDGCANCITLMPVLKEIGKDQNINVFFTEASELTKEIVEKYEVLSIPTVLLLFGTELLGKVKGYQPKEILELWIEAKIQDHQKKVD